MTLSEFLAIVCAASLFLTGIAVNSSENLRQQRDDVVAQRDTALKRANELAAKFQALQPMGKVQSMPEALGEGW